MKFIIYDKTINDPDSGVLIVVLVVKNLLGDDIAEIHINNNTSLADVQELKNQLTDNKKEGD